MVQRQKRRPKSLAAQTSPKPPTQSYPASAHFKSNQTRDLATLKSSYFWKIRAADTSAKQHQTLQEETSQQISLIEAKKDARIQSFLVISITLGAFGLLVFSLYAYSTTRNLVWPLGDILLIGYFWKITDHFIFRE